MTLGGMGHHSTAPRYDRQTITVEDAARLLGIARGTAYAAARRGQLPTIRFGARIVVPLAALDAMLASGRPPHQAAAREGES
jgi:excisionase family DNA binding protein